MDFLPEGEGDFFFDSASAFAMMNSGGGGGGHGGVNGELDPRLQHLESVLEIAPGLFLSREEIEFFFVLLRDCRLTLQLCVCFFFFCVCVCVCAAIAGLTMQDAAERYEDEEDEDAVGEEDDDKMTE